MRLNSSMPPTSTEKGQPLIGPLPLSFDEIEAVIREGRSGVFALGRVDAHNQFRIGYVGNAYDDLRDALVQRIGTAPMFKYDVTSSKFAAFIRVCELFHKFHPSGNFLHPERARGTDWRCPYCG